MIDPTVLNWQKAADGLLPAIIQDADTHQVLMLGFMNQVALEQTIETNLVTFYSRTKQRLWQKGEESGHTLSLIDMVTDCDTDTILIQARPNGSVCHTGSLTCFSKERFGLEVIGNLLRTIQERSQTDATNSYTKQLLDGGIEAYGAKVLEESKEVVQAARIEGRQRTIEEASDLLYHLLVLLQGENISIGEIGRELQKREKAP